MGKYSFATAAMEVFDNQFRGRAVMDTLNIQRLQFEIKEKIQRETGLLIGVTFEQTSDHDLTITDIYLIR